MMCVYLQTFEAALFWMKKTNAYKCSFFPCSINIWNRLPCSAVSHVIPSVDNFHKFAMPAIRVMQPLYGAAIMNFYVFFI